MFVLLWIKEMKELNRNKETTQLTDGINKTDFQFGFKTKSFPQKRGNSPAVMGRREGRPLSADVLPQTDPSHRTPPMWVRKRRFCSRRVLR